MSRKIVGILAASLLTTGLAGGTTLPVPTGPAAHLASGSGCCAR